MATGVADDRLEPFINNLIAANDNYRKASAHVKVHTRPPTAAKSKAKAKAKGKAAAKQ